MSKPASAAPRTSPDDWDRVCRDFQHSLMMDTSLAALAENIDGCVWPIRDADETPAVYVELPHADALARLRSAGLPATALDQLVVILRGTLAFDESFGEMVDIAGKAEADLDPVARNLERLGIPLEFPVTLCHFTPGTLEFCAREHITVLGDFLAFSRGASRQVIIGGEFRELLNAIAHIDEATLARYVPFRLKTSGLFLVEGLALLVRDLPDDQRRLLVAQPETLAGDSRAKGARLAAHFAGQVAEMNEALAQGTPISRLVAPLDDLALEPVVASLLKLYLHLPALPAAAPRKPGFLQRLLGWLK